MGIEQQVKNTTHINVGDQVQIKKIDNETRDYEDYYYLKKYENKLGTITECIKCISGEYAYRVEFEKEQWGYFYSYDFVE
ncbi:hypothetical protein [Ornithinibacillus halophilus]|uniref:Uncharacterized protein n=1 Tax=Ornithinibacillus halophilus TaxID=930117 RepID=A0A1M5LFV5_9BACI|nr:hypothetical protein [Ornithinibacillus halophilus]SHG63845.1 hypothetical protein SAMN05216225_10478 [Ornithinibacillus halophilus]